MSKPWLLSTPGVADSYVAESRVLDLVSDLKARGYELRDHLDREIPHNWNPRNNVVHSADVILIYVTTKDGQRVQAGKLGRIFRWARGDAWYNHDFPVLEKVGDVMVVDI